MTKKFTSIEFILAATGMAMVAIMMQTGVGSAGVSGGWRSLNLAEAATAPAQIAEARGIRAAAAAPAPLQEDVIYLRARN